MREFVRKKREGGKGVRKGWVREQKGMQFRPG